ncbi:Rec8 like protein-domain-containing protein [Phlyctochytrium arcticum]|nr:Rec8 like protein-domain-containing protein [Phlyctochytrium arcticum]
MFYPKDILANKRRSGMAVVWLAATLGPRHSFRKLSKKEVNGVDVAETCAVLQDPPEPMALRLSSNLMVGVTRILAQQYAFFYAEVNHVFTKLRKAWGDMYSANVNMNTHETARVDAITLQPDQDGILPDEPSLNLDGEGNADMGRHLAFGWIADDGRDVASSRSRTPNSSAKSPTASFSFGGGNSVSGMGGGSSHMGSTKDITLQGSSQAGTPFYQSSVTSGQALPLGLTIGPEGGADLLMPPNNEDGLSFGFENEFDLFADIMEDRGGQQKRRRLQAGAITDLATLDFFGEDLLQVDTSAHAADMDQQPDHVYTGYQPDFQEEEHHQQVPDVLEPDSHNGLSIFVDVADPVPVQLDDAVDHTKAKSRKRKLLFDRNTQISNADMMVLRVRAGQDLDQAELRFFHKSRKQADTALLAELLTRPAMDVGDDLTRFWQNTAVSKKRKAFALALENATGPARKRNKGFDLPADNQQYGDIDFAQQHLEDYGPPEQLLGEPEEYASPEAFRAADDRRKSEVMPWHRSSRGGSVASELQSRNSRQSSAQGSALKSRDSMSTFMDGFLTPSTTTRRRSASVTGSYMDTSPLKGIPDFEDFSFGDGGDEHAVFTESDMRAAGVEGDALDFVNFVKDHGLTRGTETVSFFDLIPPSNAGRNTATQAFYHVLALATRDVIQVEQVAPYADISIKVKA